MHDLIRLYATSLQDQHAECDGREGALARLLSFTWPQPALPPRIWTPPRRIRRRWGLLTGGGRWGGWMPNCPT